MNCVPGVTWSVSKPLDWSRARRWGEGVRGDGVSEVRGKGSHGPSSSSWIIKSPSTHRSESSLPLLSHLCEAGGAVDTKVDTALRHTHLEQAVELREDADEKMRFIPEVSDVMGRMIRQEWVDGQEWTCRMRLAVESTRPGPRMVRCNGGL